MTLKEIIIEELENLNEYFHESGKEQLDENQIELFADNIISRMDWQVIASGVARIDYVFDHKVLFIGYGHQPIYLLMKYIEDNHLDGKNIEIAVRVKED